MEINKKLLAYLVKLGFDVYSMNGESGTFLKVDYSKEYKKQRSNSKNLIDVGNVGTDMYEEIVKSVISAYPRSEVTNAVGNNSVVLLLKE